MTKILLTILCFIALIALITATWSVLHGWFKNILTKLPGWILAGVLIFVLYVVMMRDIKKDPEFYAPLGIRKDSVSIENLQELPDKWRGVGDTILKNGIRLVKGDSQSK